MEYNEIITARVTAVHRERYALLCEKGECYGRLKTKEYYLDQAAFPTAGDYVTSADFGITAHESVGLPAAECLMVQELVPGGLDGITGQVRYDLDYETLR